MKYAIFNLLTGVLNVCDANCKRACEVPRANVKRFER